MPIIHEGEKKIYRLQLRRGDALNHGFTEKCIGCQAILAGAPRRGHSEECRTRLENAIRPSNGGQQRINKQKDRENEKLARKIEENIEKDKLKEMRFEELCGERGVTPSGGGISNPPKEGGRRLPSLRRLLLCRTRSVSALV